MKVEFGLSNVHVGSYTVGEDGEVTMGTPMHIPGAVGLTLEEESELYQFFADDGAYYSEYTGASETGELTMALFPDDFKTQFLGYVKTDDAVWPRLRVRRKHQSILFLKVKQMTSAVATFSTTLPVAASRANTRP